MTKARACKVVSQKESPRVKENVKEWTLTLPKELPLWELESQFKEWLQGPNPMSWGVLYIIKKLLKRRCLKWVCITHLEIWNISYGQKKGHESNWQFDSQPLKVKNRPNFLVCRWSATYCWKSVDEGYNFVLDLISIGGLHTKLWGPKVTKVPTLAISGLPLGSLETKSHLDVSLMERHKIYYKGESGGFPQVRAMVSLVSPNLFVARPNIKSATTMH